MVTYHAPTASAANCLFSPDWSAALDHMPSRARASNYLAPQEISMVLTWIQGDKSDMRDNIQFHKMRVRSPVLAPLVKDKNPL